MEERIRVGVLMGGTSAERQVSLASGIHVCGSFDPNRYEVMPIEIGKDSKWYIHHPDSPILLTRCGIDATPAIGEVYEAPSPVYSELVTARVVRSRVDVVFPVLHGPGGEDGTLQGFLETLDIPFVGSGVLASALSMDKARAKTFLRASGLPTPDWFLIRREDWSRSAAEWVDRVTSTMPGGCFIKPNDQGSSLGVSKVPAGQDPTDSIQAAFSWAAEVLVEKSIAGREFTCGVFGQEHPEALPVTEIRASAGFFDYFSKYQPGAAEEITPADLSQDLASDIQRLAVETHQALGCAGITRTDFLLEGDRPLIIEINTIPGMSRVSLIPRACEALGMEFSVILDRLVGEALFKEDLAPVAG